MKVSRGARGAKFVGQVGKPAADWGAPSGPGLLCGAANPGCSRLSAGSLRLATGRFLPQETLPKGPPPARVNALFAQLPTHSVAALLALTLSVARLIAADSGVLLPV